MGLSKTPTGKILSDFPLVFVLGHENYGFPNVPLNSIQELRLIEKTQAGICHGGDGPAVTGNCVNGLSRSGFSGGGRKEQKRGRQTERKKERQKKRKGK